MRLVLVSHSLQAGGAERVMAHLASAWAERGWDITVVTLAPQHLDSYTLAAGVRRIALDLARESTGVPQALAANIRRVLALRRVLRTIRPDALVAMMTTAAVHGCVAALGLRCRVVVSERIHPPMVPTDRRWAYLRRITYPHAHRVVMLSADGLRWLDVEVPTAKGAVVPNPVAYPLPVGEPVLAPGDVIAPDRKLLLAVGRLDVQKGFPLLLHAFASIAHRYPAWDLVILGKGPECPRLRQQAAALGLEERVALPGRVGNIGDWYSRADLFVLSSRFEGFPNALAEAMAHGCAAVSYDCDTGPRDIIRHDIDGLLVRPVGNVPALTRALARLMDDDLERERMATRAVEIRRRYSLEKILPLWDEVLERAP